MGLTRTLSDSITTRLTSSCESQSFSRSKRKLRGRDPRPFLHRLYLSVSRVALLATWKIWTRCMTSRSGIRRLCSKQTIAQRKYYNLQAGGVSSCPRKLWPTRPDSSTLVSTNRSRTRLLSYKSKNERPRKSSSSSPRLTTKSQAFRPRPPRWHKKRKRGALGPATIRLYLPTPLAEVYLPNLRRHKIWGSARQWCRRGLWRRINRVNF